MQNNSMIGKTVAILAELGPVGNLAESVIQAILDVAYLLGNLDGWFSEKQDQYFEIIAAGLGKKPADVSPDAVGLNAKLAHLRGRIPEEKFLDTFLAEVRPVCEMLGRTPNIWFENWAIQTNGSPTVSVFYISFPYAVNRRLNFHKVGKQQKQTIAGGFLPCLAFRLDRGDFLRI